MSKTLAARLLAPNHNRIAKAVTRQIQRTVPSYQRIDAFALERNTRTILSGLQKLLEGADAQSLQAVLGNVVQLRHSAGFRVSDLLLAGMCFQPVVRRYLVAQAASPAEGLAAYEAVEEIGLPLFGFLLDSFLESEDEDEVTPPLGFRLPLRKDGTFEAMLIESAE